MTSVNVFHVGLQNPSGRSVEESLLRYPFTDDLAIASAHPLLLGGLLKCLVILKYILTYIQSHD